VADVAVLDNPEERRFEAHVEGRLAGILRYGARPGVIALVHTEVDDRFEGEGVGSALVRGALDQARANGQVVLPFCPFVNGYIDKHREEYLDLVPEDQRKEFGL
jgi:uncharacterized protein